LEIGLGIVVAHEPFFILVAPIRAFLSCSSLLVSPFIFPFILPFLSHRCCLIGVQPPRPGSSSSNRYEVSLLIQSMKHGGGRFIGIRLRQVDHQSTPITSPSHCTCGSPVPQSLLRLVGVFAFLNDCATSLVCIKVMFFALRSH
jgi:hypothetical protein